MSPGTGPQCRYGIYACREANTPAIKETIWERDTRLLAWKELAASDWSVLPLRFGSNVEFSF